MDGMLLDFEAPGFIQDPYPAYRGLRERAPVYRAPGGDWYLSRYEDAAFLLKNPAFMRPSRGASPLTREARPASAAEQLVANWLVFQDGAAHDRLRRRLAGAFQPRAVAGLRARVQDRVDRLLEEVEPRGAMDVVADLAYPLPVMVISELLGIPEDDRQLFRGWADALTRALDRGDPADMKSAGSAVDAMKTYFGALRRKPRAFASTGPAGILQSTGQAMSGDEWMATWTFLLWAGHETTKNAIASGLLTLLAHPAALDLLRREPESGPAVVEECLRYEAPIQKVGRWARSDVRFGDVTVTEGQYVVALIGAANRDPSRFPEPDRFDPARRDGPHLSFGLGAHHCLGAPLARLETEIAIVTVIRRFLRLEPGWTRPAWRPYSAFRSLESLPVTFRAR